MIDLEEIRRCNARLKALIAEEIDESALRVILDKRKELISGRRERYVKRDTLSDVVISRRGEIAFGFPVESVKEVRKNYSVPLVHGNQVVVGLFQARGQIHTLVDILPLIDQTITGQAALDGGYIMHLTCEKRDVGVVVDEIVGCRTLYLDEIASGRADDSNGIVSSISKDLVSVIDVKALFSSPGIVLDRGGGRV